MTSHSSIASPITHYENFPVASILCPANLRAAIVAIYQFARTADDLADEGDASAQQRLADLQVYRQDLHRAFTPEPPPSQHWPQVFGPLQVAIGSHALPPQPLHDLLDAFVQDVEKSGSAAGYADQTELLDYCRRSANPIGRLLLHLYGITDAQALERSDAICSALQLINFCQDLSIDIPRGRYYLTDEDCARFGVVRADLATLRQTSNATLLIAAYADFARVLMLKGCELVHTLPGRSGWELRLVVQGGLRILDKIETLRFATLTQRPVLQTWDYVVMVWRALWM
jgi:squalene synthase HpnC